MTKTAAKTRGRRLPRTNAVDEDLSQEDSHHDDGGTEHDDEKDMFEDDEDDDEVQVVEQSTDPEQSKSAEISCIVLDDSTGSEQTNKSNLRYTTIICTIMYELVALDY